MRRILIGLILIIVYGSLYPWHFVRWPQGAVLAWPHTLDAGDVLVNILLYIPLGACAYWAFEKQRPASRFLAPVALALLLSTSMELLQAFEPARSSEASDVLSNTGGAAIGMLLAAFFPLRPSPELFLLACWMGHLQFFGSAGWPAECAGWLILVSASMPQRTLRWRGPLAVACYLAILFRGLSPFHFVSAAAPFHWVPFEGFILANRPQVLPMLFAKLFWYSAAVWVLRRIHLPWMVAGAAAASFLAAIEVAQRHIPPHVSEITDPLMALLLAAAFAAIPMLTVVAGVIRRDGRILICQRKRGGRHALKWEFPGGKVEKHESPARALERELEEELGIAARAGKELARYEFRYPSRAPILLIFYEVSWFPGEPANRIFEQILWEEPSRLAAYDFLDGDARFLRQLAG
jgi:8-oxo-dGTP diphosphatase